MNWRYFILFLAVLSTDVVAADEQQQPNTYGSDVTAVYSLLRTVKLMSDTCSNVFPGTAERHYQALLDWRNRYSDFIEEIEGRFLQLFYLDAGQDESRYKAAVAKFEAGFESRRKAEEKMLVETRHEALRKECLAFPEVLQSEQMNIEVQQTERVTRLREAVPLR